MLYRTIRPILDSTLSFVWYIKDNSLNVSETGSVSVLRWTGQDKLTQFGPLEKLVGLSCPVHLRTDTDPVSKTLRFFVFYIPDDG
jgi:hypothetical protein